MLKIVSINHTVYKYGKNIDYYDCDCDCGNKCVKSTLYLNSKYDYKKSCGCYTETGRKVPSGYWTYERCKEEALKYKTIDEFYNTNTSVLTKIYKNNWGSDMLSHIKYGKISHTKEECYKVALKYKRRNDFQKNDATIYMYSHRYGWIEDICSHMNKPSTVQKRIIYVYEFDDNNCYVGLTCDEIMRHKNHMRKGPIFKYMKKTGKIPEKKFLTEYISVDEAKKMEEIFMKKYIDDGWTLLNTNKAGGIGGVNKYNKKRCKEEALKYTDYNLFRKEKIKICNAIFRNKWYDLFSHMENKSYRFRTKEDLHKIALKYSNKSEFARKEQKQYRLARKNGWLDDICSHMPPSKVVKKRITNRWTYERCEEESKKYKSKNKFREGNSGAYYRSLRQKWLDIFFPKLDPLL